MLTMLAYSQMILQSAVDRNERLTNEITELEKSIEEIDGLERQKERLLARMEIIDQLQKSRPEIVHLFDEMVRQLARRRLPDRHEADRLARSRFAVSRSRVRAYRH